MNGEFVGKKRGEADRTDAQLFVLSLIGENIAVLLKDWQGNTCEESEECIRVINASCHFHFVCIQLACQPNLQDRFEPSWHLVLAITILFHVSIPAAQWFSDGVVYFIDEETV